MVSLVAVAGCAHVDPEPEAQLDTETSALELEAEAAPGAAAAFVAPAVGSRLDARQLAAIPDKAALAAAGQACSDSNIGTVCADPILATVRDCGGFTGTCDSTGTKDVLPLRFLCLPRTDGAPGNACTALVNGPQRTVDCVVPTNGHACSTGCGGTICKFPTECSEHGNEVRGCLSGGTCSNDACINEVFTQDIVGTCTRETDGNDCTPLRPCEGQTRGLCTSGGACACLLGPQ